MQTWSSTKRLAGSHADWQTRLGVLIGDVFRWSKPLQPIANKLKRGVELNLEDGLVLYGPVSYTHLTLPTNSLV